MAVLEKVFLDTSVIEGREFGNASIRTQIENSLLAKKKLASTLVKMEINRTFVRDAIFLHTLLFEDRDLSVVFKRLQSFPITPRQSKRCLRLLECITDRNTLRVVDALARLENVIQGVSAWLLRDISLIESGTCCPLADRQAVHRSGTYEISTSCNRALPSCNIAAYIERSVTDLQKILSAVKGNRDHEKLAGVLEQVIRDPAKAKGRNCMDLADTIICLDSPADCIIHSLNIVHFEPICRCLGKSFFGIKF